MDFPSSVCKSFMTFCDGFFCIKQIWVPLCLVFEKAWEKIPQILVALDLQIGYHPMGSPLMQFFFSAHFFDGAVITFYDTRVM